MGELNLDPAITGAAAEDPRLQVAAPPVAATPQQPAQLTAEDIDTMSKVPGVDPQKIAALRAQVDARGPAANMGNGPEVLGPAPQQQAPQYKLEQVPVGSSATSSSSGLDPKSVKAITQAQNALTQAYAKQQESMAPQIARDAAEADREAALAKTRAENSAKYTIESANLRDEIARNNEGARKKLEADVADYLKQGDKVDSNRVWHRMDSGQKPAFAISAAMAGFGEALARRGGNPVLEMLSAAEERDMRAQEMALNAKARGIQMKDSLYGRLIEEGHSKEIAKQADLVAKNNTISDQIAAQQAQAKTAPEQERMAQAKAAWDVKSAQDNMQLQQMVARHTTNSTVTQKQAVLVDQNGVPAGQGGDTIPGTKVIDPAVAKTVMADKAQAKEAREVSSKLQAGVDSVRRMIALRKEMGTEVWNDEKIQEYEANKQAAVGAFTGMANSGTLNAGEYPRYAAMLPGLGLHFDDAKRLVGGNDPTLLKLQGVEKALSKSANTSLRSYGMALADRSDVVRQVRDKNGQVYSLRADGTIARQ